MREKFINIQWSKITPGLLFTLLWLFSGNIFAAECSFTPPNAVLPSSSSTVVNTSSLSAQGMTAMRCPGTIIITKPSSFTLEAKISSTASNLNLKNTTTGDLIPYSIYKDLNTGSALKVGDTITYSNDSSLLTVNSNTITANIPLYFRTPPGTIISAGTYIDRIALSWNYNICIGGIVGLCLGGSFSGNPTINTVVTLEVTKDCLINSAPDVNFGSATFTGQFNPVSQSVTFTCTKGTTFNSYVSDGMNPVSGWQQMKLISATKTDFLQYNFYQETGTTLWNSTSKKLGIGTGQPQSVPFTAVINPNQLQKTPGNYQDNVSLVVEY